MATSLHIYHVTNTLLIFHRLLWHNVLRPLFHVVVRGTRSLSGDTAKTHYRHHHGREGDDTVSGRHDARDRSLQHSPHQAASECVFAVSQRSG